LILIVIARILAALLPRDLLLDEDRIRIASISGHDRDASFWRRGNKNVTPVLPEPRRIRDNAEHVIREVSHRHWEGLFLRAGAFRSKDGSLHDRSGEGRDLAFDRQIERKRRCELLRRIRRDFQRAFDQ
jgi:hypothetical protein